MLVDLFAFTVLLQKAAEHTDTEDPNALAWRTGVESTELFTKTTVATLALGNGAGASTSARMHYCWLADNDTVLD